MEGERMKVLAIDTSTNCATCAICDDESIIAEFSINNKLTHSQKIASQIESMYKISGEDMKDTSLVVVSNGPGSFTGIRIGVSLAKSIAHVLNAPVVEVSSLELLAGNHVDFCGYVIPLVDAQRNKLYYNVYKNNLGNVDGVDRSLDKVYEDGVIEVEKLVELINRLDEPSIVVGEASAKLRGFIEDNKIEGNLENNRNIVEDGKVSFSSPAFDFNRAAVLAQIGIQKYKRGEGKSFFDIRPKYIRKSQAEMEYEKKHGHPVDSKKNDLKDEKEGVDVDN